MPMMLPPSAPIMISIKATDKASRIEISEDASASAIHSAEVNQILSIISHARFVRVRHQADAGSEAWRRDWPKKIRLARPIESYRSARMIPKSGKRFSDKIMRKLKSVGVISQTGGFGGLHPHRDER